MSGELSAHDALIRRWQEEAAELAARAARLRAADQGSRFQIHRWETRAQALRDCAVELWQLAVDEPAALRAAEREACVAEIFAYADNLLADGIGAVYRDAARVLLRGRGDIEDAVARVANAAGRFKEDSSEEK